MTRPEAQRSKIDSLSARNTDRVRSFRTGYYLVMAVALMTSGCSTDHSQSYFSENDASRHQLAINDVQSFLYLEPGTQIQIPQVRGSLRNLSNRTLVLVEFTLSFKNRRNEVIFEETAYPVYVSSLSHAQGSKPLLPGQQVRFAFKSPACPKDWQPGQVDVHVTKVVAGNS
jgi:hypothetical protein